MEPAVKQQMRAMRDRWLKAALHFVLALRARFDQRLFVSDRVVDELMIAKLEVQPVDVF